MVNLAFSIGLGVMSFASFAFNCFINGFMKCVNLQNGSGRNGDVVDGMNGGGSLNGTMRTAPRTPSSHHKNGGNAYHSNPVRHKH